MEFTRTITTLALIVSAVGATLATPQMFPEVLNWSIFDRIILSITELVVVGILYKTVSTYTYWIVYVRKFSGKLAYALYLLIFHPFSRLLFLLIILIAIITISRFNYSIISLSGLAFVVFLLSLKQFPFLQQPDEKSGQEIIFEDDFINNQGWFLNYWGTTNPSKTNRIENSAMIFEAKEEELLSSKKEFGAYIDLKNGISEGSIYEINCRVKSDPNTTMGFQLWVHDTIGGNPAVTKKEPDFFCLPSNQDYKMITLRYKANSANAIRIHLHNKGGNGRILVDRLIVSKV